MEVVAQSLVVAVGEVGTEGGVKVARTVVAVGVVTRVVAKVFVVIAVGPAATEWGGNIRCTHNDKSVRNLGPFMVRLQPHTEACLRSGTF